MADNTLDPSPRVGPAPRGSKTGWLVVSGEVPSETFDRLNLLSRTEGKARTDLVHEAVELLLERRAS
jgi:hypothetical protein